MAKFNVSGSYISENVSKIRWLPRQSQESNCFVTGSWNLNENELKLWNLSRNGDDTEFKDDAQFQGNVESDFNQDFTKKERPKLIFNGDINGIDFINNENIVLASSDGYVAVVRIQSFPVKSLSEYYIFEDLHKYETDNFASCTDLSVFEDDIATVGEDGRLNILSSQCCKVVRSIQNADSCSMTCVTYLNHCEILTGNRMGIIKLFDKRSDTDAPSNVLYVSCEDEKISNCINCITYHPTQKHIILTGSEEGSICAWDLRQPQYPASYLSAHDRAITEIRFHPTEPNKLFTSSESGELSQWSHNAQQIVESSTLPPNNTNDNINPWLSGERIKNKVNWNPIIENLNKPINSFDVSGTKIISSCDNEAIYLIENVA